MGELVEKCKKEYDEEVKLNEGKQGKQKRREHLCCLFIGCIFKFVNLFYGPYPEFTHSVFLFLVSDMMQKEKGTSR